MENHLQAWGREGRGRLVDTWQQGLHVHCSAGEHSAQAAAAEDAMNGAAQGHVLAIEAADAHAQHAQQPRSPEHNGSVPCIGRAINGLRCFDSPVVLL